jgi:hypothetical protein
MIRSQKLRKKRVSIKALADSIRKKPKLKPLKSLRRKAWELMSLHTRKSAADHTDQCHCVTCGTYDHWKNFDAGHYIHISKQHPLSYDERNVHPQCRSCNYFKHKGVEYANFMYKAYGPKVVDELIERKKEPYMRRPELEAVIDQLAQKLAAPYAEVPF